MKPHTTTKAGERTQREIIGKHRDGTTCYHADRCPLVESQSTEVSSPAVPKGHTPGPWKIFNNYYDKEFEFNIEKDAYTIAQINSNLGDTHEHELADARLIAAAPDLLEALQSVERVLSTYSDKIESWQWHMLKSVRSAIAKAEGRQ